MADVRIPFGGWGRSTWGSQAWNEGTLNVTGTTAIGTVAVSIDHSIAVTGNQGTSAVGSVSVTQGAGVNVSVTAVSYTHLTLPTKA